MTKKSNDRDTPIILAKSDRQGQAAMDAALAHPLSRIFLGFLFLLTVFGFVNLSISEVVGDHSLLRKSLALIALPMMFGPMLIELGSVALYGKSRTPWYRALMRNWRSK